MVNVVLCYTSLNCNEEISDLFVYKGDQLYFVDIPLYSRSVTFSSPPLKVYFSLLNMSDIQRLHNICSRYEDVEIIIETSTQFNEINRLTNGKFSVLNTDVSDVLFKKLLKQEDDF